MWENEYALDPIYIYIYIYILCADQSVYMWRNEINANIYMGTTGCIYVYMHIYIYTYISRKLHI